MLEDFFKVPPSHIKVPPDQYKGLQATSKGHASLVILVATMGKCKQANEFQSCHYGHLTLLIIHEKLAQFAIQDSPTLKRRHHQLLVSKTATKWLLTLINQAKTEIFYERSSLPSVKS